jgi:uncharacterized membrane protein YozB (DUF420 family)
LAAGIGESPAGPRVRDVGDDQATSVSESVKQARPRLVWSVVAAALFFLPLGLIAVFFSWRTDVWNRRGETDKAQRASRWALAFIVITLVVGVLVYVALIGALLALGAFSGGQ